MRIYQPKNELGQAILNEGQLVATSKTISKNLVDGAITLTDSDVSGITNWDVKNVQVTIKGQKMNFTAGVERTATGLIIRFADASEAGRLEFTDAVISLQLSDTQGIVEQELSIDVLIAQAISTGDNTKVDKFVDKVIAGGSKEEIQGLGAKLADSGIEEYSLAGAKTANEAKTIMTTGVGNLGAFSQPIATLANAGKYNEQLVLNDTNFVYNMMSLENGCGLFDSSNITSFTGKMCSLTYACQMFRFCKGLTSWTVDLPQSMTDASDMFEYCSGLTSWTVDFPSSLTTASGMFYNCTGLKSWTVALPDSLTDAVGMFHNCTGLTSWTAALPQSLTNAGSMFSGCTGLTSWTVELPSSLAEVKYMFNGCTGLTSWTVALPQSMTSAAYMFNNCKLNLTSVQKIAETIPTITDGKSHSITIGMGCTQASFNDHSTGWYDAIETIKSKGWTVSVQYKG